MKSGLFFAVVAFLAIFTIGVSAQTQEPIGKIISNTEATRDFGAIKTSVAVQVGSLASLLKSSSEHVMFGIFNGHAIGLSGKRIPFLIDNAFLDANVVLHLFTTKIVLQLLDGKTEGTLYFQEREERFTIEFNGQVLEYSSPCPPLCIE